MSDNKITYLDKYTELDIPVERVLEGAKDQLDQVFILGWDKEGNLYSASSHGDIADLNLLLELGKQSLFAQVDV